MNFIWFSYGAVRDATYARGCRVPPLGAPLHLEHESTWFGGLLGGHPVLFGMSAGGVSTKIAPRSMQFHMLLQGACAGGMGTVDLWGSSVCYISN